LFKRYVGFALLEQEYFQSDAFAAVCKRVQQAQRDQAMLLSDRPTPKQQNWMQEELTSKILRGMQGIQQSVTLGLTVCRAIGKGVCEIVDKLSVIGKSVHDVWWYQNRLEGKVDEAIEKQRHTHFVLYMVNRKLDHFLGEAETKRLPDECMCMRDMAYGEYASNVETMSGTIHSPISPIQFETQSLIEPILFTPGFQHTAVGNEMSDSRKDLARSLEVEPQLERNRKRKTYDTVKNTKGQPRKRKPRVELEARPFRKENYTATDFWEEYNYGLVGEVSLCNKEVAGRGWRSDKLYPKPDGTIGTALKGAWSSQLPIYQAIECMIQEGGMSEVDALKRVQGIFNRRKYAGGKPRLDKEMRKRLSETRREDFVPSGDEGDTSLMNPRYKHMEAVLFSDDDM
jgi:hypothetical protein